MTEYGVTSSGFIPKPYSVILEELKQLAKQEFGEDIDLSENSRLLRFLEIVAKREDELWQMAEDAYYAGFIDFATGQNLDRLVAILGIRRKQALKSTGVVTFSRSTPATSDIVIPAGTKVATADESGSHGNVAANTITKIVDPISGIEAVNNPNPTEGGRDAETDEELRYRAKTYAPYAKATVYSIKAAILGIEGVIDALVKEDITNHTANVIVEGGGHVNITSLNDYSIT